MQAEGILFLCSVYHGQRSLLKIGSLTLEGVHRTQTNVRGQNIVRECHLTKIENHEKMTSMSHSGHWTGRK
ncbi:hypothetical protein Hanom_Chr03g00265531 [Helianthus anomalus]